jgi:hypothetical protein
MDTRALGRALVMLEDTGTAERLAFEAFLALATDASAIKLQAAVWVQMNRKKLEAFQEVLRLASDR